MTQIHGPHVQVGYENAKWRQYFDFLIFWKRSTGHNFTISLKDIGWTVLPNL